MIGVAIVNILPGKYYNYLPQTTISYRLTLDEGAHNQQNMCHN
jgi:hypothetical protein